MTRFCVIMKKPLPTRPPIAKKKARNRLSSLASESVTSSFQYIVSNPTEIVFFLLNSLRQQDEESQTGISVQDVDPYTKCRILTLIITSTAQLVSRESGVSWSTRRARALNPSFSFATILLQLDKNNDSNTSSNNSDKLHTIRPRDCHLSHHFVRSSRRMRSYTVEQETVAGAVARRAGQ